VRKKGRVAAATSTAKRTLRVPVDSLQVTASVLTKGLREIQEENPFTVLAIRYGARNLCDFYFP
jgi:hypothetical protein